ncbi:hypothetical protein NXS19_010553 [Fusarium pseudograminearum]|nr:hypothetical protein NXS19_010553 [Fusarium pseudograminearum]
MVSILTIAGHRLLSSSLHGRAFLGFNVEIQRCFSINFVFLAFLSVSALVCDSPLHIVSIHGAACSPVTGYKTRSSSACQNYTADTIREFALSGRWNAKSLVGAPTTNITRYSKGYRKPADSDVFYMVQICIVRSASVPSSIALSVWLILTTIHLPAFSTLQYCPSRHSVTNPIHTWPRLASSAAQLPTYCTSTLRRPTRRV